MGNPKSKRKSRINIKVLVAKIEYIQERERQLGDRRKNHHTGSGSQMQMPKPDPQHRLMSQQS